MKLPLAGRLILVVEDEPIIVMDVVQALHAAGASVSARRYLLPFLITRSKTATLPKSATGWTRGTFRS